MKELEIIGFVNFPSCSEINSLDSINELLEAPYIGSLVWSIKEYANLFLIAFELCLLVAEYYETLLVKLLSYSYFKLFLTKGWLSYIFSLKLDNSKKCINYFVLLISSI